MNLGRLQRRPRHGGQSLVEFALVLPLLLLLILAVVDGGRAIFGFNGASQAARNVARVASVECFSTPVRCDQSTGAIAAAIAAQAHQLPGPRTFTVQCVDPITDAVKPVCQVGDTVKVVASTTVTPITPLLSVTLGQVTVSATSRAQIFR